MLVDQYDADILPLGSEPVKGRLDRRRLRLVIDHEKVLLRIWWIGDMLFKSRVSLNPYGNARVRKPLTPIPARRSPVTES
jgi:hypothetical protein